MTTQLDAQWIVGFVDGEGCFNIDVHKKLDMKWKLQMQPEFVVVQHEGDSQILHALKDYFGCGSVSVNKKDQWGTRYCYRVKSVQQIKEKILPFFDKHSLKTKKKIEYQRFRRICLLLDQGHHRQSLENFLEVYDLALALRGRSREKKGTSRPQGIEQIVAELRISKDNPSENSSNTPSEARSQEGS